MSTTTWPTWRYFARLIAFRPWLWGPNLVSIVLLIGLETVPALVSRAFFDWLKAGMGELQPFVWMLALFMLSTLGRVTFLFGCQFTNAPFMYTGTALLQHNMFRRLLQLPAGVALQHTSGEALSRFRDDTEETGVFLIPFNDVIAWSLFAMVGLLILLSVSVTLTVGVFVPLVVLGFVLHVLRTRIESYRRAVRTATADVTSHLGDAFGAAQLIQLANAERDVVERFRALNRIRLDSAIRDRLLDQVMQSVSRNMSNIGIGIILLLGSQSMARGGFSVGDFALFVFYLGWIGEFTALFGSTLAKYRQAGVSFGRMLELMQGSAPPSLVEHRPIFHVPSGTVVRREQQQPLDVLEVVDLTCLHPGSGRGVRHIRFEVRRGERVMVTGRVASGKTTLLRALLGVLPCQSGNVLWNGQVVEHPADFLVPPRCAYTPQVPRLFSDSLRRNLLLGLECDEVDLERAVIESQFSADLSALQAGLESEVGARGVALSGGQMQRAALARMLVRPAELLVLDDLSSLDGPTEDAVWSALVADRSRTIVAATHRRAALRRSDRVLVLSKGELVGQGPLEHVLASCEEMRTLWAASSE